jgi:hypothetical protein
LSNDGTNEPAAIERRPRGTRSRENAGRLLALRVVSPEGQESSCPIAIVVALIATLILRVLTRYRSRPPTAGGRPHNLFWRLQPPVVAAGRYPLQEGRQGAFTSYRRDPYPCGGRLKRGWTQINSTSQGAQAAPRGRAATRARGGGARPLPRARGQPRATRARSSSFAPPRR